MLVSERRSDLSLPASQVSAPQIGTVLETILDTPAFRSACAALSEGRSEAVLCGLVPSAKAFVVAGLAWKLRRTFLVLTSDDEAAERFRETAATVLDWLEPEAGRSVSTLPAWDGSPYEPEARSPHAELAERRAVALWNLARGVTRVLCVSAPAALARFRELPFYASLALELKVNEELNRESLLEHLASVGYESMEPVENIGQYSVRGGIVDVFSPEADWPLRIEFSGDRIESLREFDPGTQRTRQQIPSALLRPLSECWRSTRFFAALVEALRARTPNRNRTHDETQWAPCAGPFPGWEYFVPLAEPHPNSLLSLAGKPCVIWDEKLERREQVRQALEGWAAAYDEVRDTVPPRPRPEDLLFTATEFLEVVATAPQLDLKELAFEHTAVAGRDVPAHIDTVEGSDDARRRARDAPGESPGLAAPREFLLPTQPTLKLQGDVKALVADLRTRQASRETVVLVVPTAGKADRLKDLLNEYEFAYLTLPRPAVGGEPAQRACPPVLIAHGEMAAGLQFTGLGLTFLADSDLFGSFVWGKRARRGRSGISSFISSLHDLRQGDYVVHVDHGIGIYHGLRQLEVEGSPRDFMLLTYQDDAKLYVPLERLDLVEKYRSGGDGSKPQLDRLGSGTWQRTKTRVKRALRDMAQELLQLYAERKMRGGTAFSSDSPWQREFEDAFPFEETPDQLTALVDIKRDLEASAPMDRLLCGDVGYGKTELAMRATLKVVQDSKQVAVLAPTTVLALQHFETFRQRLAAFPVRVEMLSRFRSRSEQKKILAEAQAGTVDVLIGTHRLLSKDVAFRDLGLLIVDEEQRFGVSAKEKLKKLKTGVDVLTMTATPIPRTLHMSLAGLRDLSVIETPPQGRLAIQTTVAPFGDALIQSAVLQEMQRQGQVYFVHNRVESVYSMAALVQRLVPTARIGVAHGQMNEAELEKAMVKFMTGEYDVLVSTALIENGLDIPRANTIIVNQADRFGLADLYQLRGRVGRSNRRAYAYFLISAEESLTPLAKRRLAALKEFSDLGAGFRLAALDLELRGAGNLLGREQHGHLNAIGIDLYLKMLEQTVDELRGAPARPEVHTSLNLGLDIKIPSAYIADEGERLRMYKRISGLAAPEARPDLEAELDDRYGPIPPSVSNLLSYALLKSAAEGILVHSIERRGDEVSIRFHERAPVDAGKLTRFVRLRPGSGLRPNGVLHFRLQEGTSLLLEQVQNVLHELRAQH